MNEDLPPYMTAKAVARYFGITEGMVGRMLTRKELIGSKNELGIWQIAREQVAVLEQVLGKRDERTMTAMDLARTLKMHHQRIVQAIERGVIPATRIGAVWRIHPSVQMEQVAQQLALEEQERLRPKPITCGSPTQCGCCGKDQGNILGDVVMGQRKGYLCLKCMRLLRVVEEDLERAKKVLLYIRGTRTPLTQREKRHVESVATQERTLENL